ncbi:MAG: hypothetical protein WC484_08535 [Candidatus Omnitrophota bacterium]
MKRTMVSMLILAVLSFWIPSANAEVSQDLDPMVSPEPQATVTNENSMNNTNTSQTGSAVSTPETTTADKKVEETKKGKSKKSSKKKSSKKKSSFKSSKKQKGNAY